MRNICEIILSNQNREPRGVAKLTEKEFVIWRTLPHPLQHLIRALLVWHFCRSSFYHFQLCLKRHSKKETCPVVLWGLGLAFLGSDFRYRFGKNTTKPSK